MIEALEIDVDSVRKNKSKFILVDVRESHETLGPEGHIEGVIFAPLGTQLHCFLTSADPHKNYIFICRSGCRSGQACQIAHTYGFQKVYNMRGGMLAWNKIIFSTIT
jgi:rhodanese-related sulfurtransferase